MPTRRTVILAPWPSAVSVSPSETPVILNCDANDIVANPRRQSVETWVMIFDKFINCICVILGVR